MEPECLLSCSQHPVTDPYPEPDASSPRFHTSFRLRSIIPFSHLRQIVPSGLFASGLPTKACTCFSSSAFYNNKSNYMETFIRVYVKDGTPAVMQPGTVHLVVNCILVIDQLFV